MRTPSRRVFLQAGSSAVLGLSLPSLFAASPPSRSVILVHLGGGLSHLDSLDMKPDAPAEIRGEFKSIATALPGVRVCEHLPKLAARLKQWAIVRSLSHDDYGHLPATHRLLTGAPMPLQRGSDLDNVLSRRDFPCYAAGLSAVRPRRDGGPSGVTLPHALIEGPLTWPGQHAGLLGPGHDPLLVTQNPNKPTFRMDSYSLPEGMDGRRVEQRRGLLERLASDGPIRRHQERAFGLLSSGKVAEAFRIEKEPAKTRERYGRNSFGQSLLLSRRLIQAGVPLVQANMGIVQTWDTHVDNWARLKDRLLPWLDQGLAALIDDLEAEGRLGETLVACLGEFGRTPKVSTLPGETKPGRDHWAKAYSGLFAGGGVKGGRVIGATDRTGSEPVSDRWTPYDVGATIYRTLGVSAEAEIRDPLDRPMRLNTGRCIEALYRG